MILKLQKRGCDFFKNDHTPSDVGNYRVFCYLKAKNGDLICGDFGGYVRKDYSKKKKGLVVNDNALSTDFQYVRDGSNDYPVTFVWNPERVGVDVKNYSYTITDILRFCSDVTGVLYDEVRFVDADEMADDAAEYQAYEERLLKEWRIRRTAEREAEERRRRELIEKLRKMGEKTEVV